TFPRLLPFRRPLVQGRLGSGQVVFLPATQGGCHLPGVRRPVGAVGLAVGPVGLVFRLLLVLLRLLLVLLRLRAFLLFFARQLPGGLFGLVGPRRRRQGVRFLFQSVRGGAPRPPGDHAQHDRPGKQQCRQRRHQRVLPRPPNDPLSHTRPSRRDLLSVTTTAQ